MLSKDLRERIIIWHYEDGMPPVEVAALAGCCVRSVYNVLQLYNRFGATSNPYARLRGRHRTLTTADVNYLHSLLLANPTLYLDELQQQLLDARGVNVSLATISRTLHRLHLSHKNTASPALEQNEMLRAVWQAAHGDIPLEYIVWIDESAVDDRTNQRRMGWAEVGRACVQRATFLRGQRYSVLPALTCDGIIALDLFEGSVTKERFLEFLHQQLVMSIQMSLMLQTLKTISGPTAHAVPRTTECRDYG